MNNDYTSSLLGVLIGTAVDHSVRIYDFSPQNRIVNRGKKFVKKILRIKE